MQIDRILFPVTTLGPGKRLAVWTIGCPHHCYNCSNPELWESDLSKEVSVDGLINVFQKYRFLVDGITITGGEPFFQSNELYLLLKGLKSIGYDDVLVYSGYKFEYIKECFPTIIENVDVLVDGLYVDSLNNNIGYKGSSNQRCIVLNRKLKDKYKDFNIKKRQRQNFISDDVIVSVGIPTKKEIYEI